MPKRAKHVLNSLLICIAVDEYQDKSISRLSFGEPECVHMERIFKIFNIAENCIFLINEAAHRKAILEALTSNFVYDHLYIYYSAHGQNINNQSYIYTYDTTIKKACETSLSVNELFNLLLNQKRKSITVIFDACGIKVESQYHNLLKIYYPDTAKTHEDTSINRSLFTKHWISKFILERTCKTGLQPSRYERIRREIAILHETDRLVLINGQSGSGKSHLLRQIHERENHTIYISLPKYKELSFDIALNLIVDEILATENSKYVKLKDVNPERYIRYFADTHLSHLLIIDHIDHLAADTLSQLVQFLRELPLFKLISSVYRHDNLHINSIYDFPALTKNDIDEVITFESHIKEDIKNVLYGCATFIELLRVMFEHKSCNVKSLLKENISIRSAVNALLVTGGFITPNLFLEAFDLEDETLSILTQIGAIVFHDGFFYPHDSIYDLEGNQDLECLHIKSFMYWKTEVKNDISNIKAIQNFVLASDLFQLTLPTSESYLYLDMISTLQGRKNSEFLSMLYEVLKNRCCNTLVALRLAESLLDVGKFEEAEEIIRIYSGNSHTLEAVSAELSWWKGDFEHCIELANSLLRKISGDETKMRLLCARGIGYFFIGNWQKAASDLQAAINQKDTSSKQTLFFAYYVLATIQGLRGTNFHLCIHNFISSLQLARSAGKISWLSLAYGNIGEILWKAGYYKKSIDILNVASHLAYLADNSPVYLEMQRNLLHAYKRDQNEEKVIEQIAKLESMFLGNRDTFVGMQLVNTLLTHYLFAGDAKYRKYLKLSFKMTYKNNEYHIYTLSNFALAALVKRKINLAYKFMRKALYLCTIGKNWLAIKQCFDDWNEILRAHNLNFILAEQAFPEWNQIIEKELAPTVHHLSNLFEYLE